jgi:hypothetical protein
LIMEQVSIYIYIYIYIYETGPPERLLSPIGSHVGLGGGGVPDLGQNRQLWDREVPPFMASALRRGAATEPPTALRVCSAMNGPVN